MGEWQYKIRLALVHDASLRSAHLAGLGCCPGAEQVECKHLAMLRKELHDSLVSHCGWHAGKEQAGTKGDGVVTGIIRGLIC